VHEGNAVRALLSPLLSVTLHLVVAILLLPLVLLFLRAILPGRWPYLALWCALAISFAALAWDSPWLIFWQTNWSDLRTSRLCPRSI